MLLFYKGKREVPFRWSHGWLVIRFELSYYAFLVFCVCFCFYLIILSLL